MLELNRLLIKDDQNNLLRILKFGSGVDKYKEPYVKICFPYFKNKVKFYKIKKPGEINDNFLEHLPYEEIKLDEFTYHYVSGVRVLKYANKHIKREEKLPTIESAKSIHLLTVIFFDLNSIPKFQKKTEELDFTLEDKFNEKSGRIVDICLSQTKFAPDIKDRTKINYFDQYEFIDKDLNVRLSVTDYEFKNKPQKKGIAVNFPENPLEKFLEYSA